MRFWFVLLALVWSSSGQAAHNLFSKSEPISIGRAHSITSVSLVEVRIVNVVVPASYATSPRKRYPVLYLIDGGLEQDLLHVSGALHLGALWGRSAEAIVVGIETKDRRKELVGPTQDPELLQKYPTAGSSKAFRTFLRDEVKPMVEQSYRSNGQDAVLGESLAGLFILETYFVEPNLFGAYGAIDPSLWWDKEALSRTAASRIGKAQQARPLYVAVAKEQLEKPEAINRVFKAVKLASSRKCLTVRSDLLHSTIYQQLTPQALQFLLPPEETAPPEFGFTVQCTNQ